MKIGNIILLLIVATSIFVCGYLFGGRSVEPIVEKIVKVDTVYYENPTIAKVEAHPVTVRVPRLMFAERVVEVSRNSESVPVEVSDSTDINIDIETVIYEDTTYRAQVSGPRIGQYGPQLDWVQAYQKTITQTVTKKSRFAVTAGVGVGLTPAGIQPIVGVSAGIILWQR
jgi:hypothetical protein